MISASHNPHYDNGIKFFSGARRKARRRCRAGDRGRARRSRSDRCRPSSSARPCARAMRWALRRSVQELRAQGLRPRRHEHRAWTAPMARPTSSARWCCANSARACRCDRRRSQRHSTSTTASARRIRRRWSRMCARPAPTSASRSTETAIACCSSIADGTVCDGDDLLYVLATDWQQSGRLRGPVVGTLMSNYGFEQALATRGIAIRAREGRRSSRAPGLVAAPGRAGWRGLRAPAVPGSRQYRRWHRQRVAGARSVATPRPDACGRRSTACSACRRRQSTCAIRQWCASRRSRKRAARRWPMHNAR